MNISSFPSSPMGMHIPTQQTKQIPHNTKTKVSILIGMSRTTITQNKNMTI